MSNGEDKGLYARHVLINYASLLVSCRDLLKLRIDGSVSGMSRQVEGSLQDVDNLKKDGLGMLCPDWTNYNN